MATFVRPCFLTFVYFVIEKSRKNTKHTLTREIPTVPSTATTRALVHMANLARGKPTSYKADNYFFSPE